MFVFSFAVVATTLNTFIDERFGLRGETAVLECPLPRAKVSWEPLPSNSVFACSNNQTLVLRNLTITQTDIYFCDTCDLNCGPSDLFGSVLLFVQRE